MGVQPPLGKGGPGETPGSLRLIVIFRLNSKLKMPLKSQKYNCLLHSQNL
jgi:hypothetical protein